jgi:hypothetical protein
MEFIKDGTEKQAESPSQKANMQRRKKKSHLRACI